MKLTSNNYLSTNFKGYDAVPIQGLYMQGLTKPAERRIFKEMKKIAKQEGFDLFVNENNSKISKQLTSNEKPDLFLSIWGQDNKSFVENNNGDVLILSNSKERLSEDFDFGEFNDFKLKQEKYMPRGGNYFLGQKQNGEKWLLINTMSLCDDEAFKRFGDKPTIAHLNGLFDVKPENIFLINEFSFDLDEVVRPLGYPYILVNDYEAALKNVEKMQEKFPKSLFIYQLLKKHIEKQLQYEALNFPESCDERIARLKSYGFEPIKIAGQYYDGINFLNAIAYKNDDDSISYITNSTKHSCPELEYLEELFEKDLKAKAPSVKNIYFVSGGKRKETESEYFLLYSKGFNENNTIMNILANRLGGIHCMCAEIPLFKNFK